MIPSIGRIVHYRLTDQDCASIAHRRRRHSDDVEWANEHGSGVTKHQVFEGNQPKAGEVYPMMITRVWDLHPTEASCVQGQVFLDGNDTIWKTSVQQHGQTYDPTVENGVWFEPVRTV